MDEQKSKPPLRLHIIPTIGAIISFFFAWGLGGHFIRMLPIGDLYIYKGLAIIALSLSVFTLVNNALYKRSLRIYLSQQQK